MENEQVNEDQCDTWPPVPEHVLPPSQWLLNARLVAERAW